MSLIGFLTRVLYKQVGDYDGIRDLLDFYVFWIWSSIRHFYNIIVTVNDYLKVSMVLIGSNRNEPNMLRSFWDLFFAGTIKRPPSNKKARSVVFILGARFIVGGNAYSYTRNMGPEYWQSLRPLHQSVESPSRLNISDFGASRLI